MHVINQDKIDNYGLSGEVFFYFFIVLYQSYIFFFSYINRLLQKLRHTKILLNLLLNDKLMVVLDLQGSDQCVTRALI